MISSFLKAPLLILLLFALAACRLHQLPPAPTATVPPEVTPGATTPSPATLSGTVVSASDVDNRPDAPLADQLVLLLPASEAPDILQVTPPLDSGLRFLSTLIERPPAGQTALRTGPDGTFRVTLPPTDHVLCLADSEDPTSTSPPYLTHGCALLQLQPGETLTVEISTMFGEIVVDEE